MTPEPLIALPGDLPPGYVAPPVPDWLRSRVSDPARRVEFRKPNGELHWRSNPGAQTWALLCPFDEILIGGRRGGSKSEALKAWLAMGDGDLADDDPAKSSFLNEPSFRALVVREEYQQLEEFIDECEDFFRPFGGKATGKPRVIDFKTGARIYFRHLGDKEAYNQARGWGLTKIAVEELTQIPEERWYLKLFGSLRNKKQIRVHGKKRFPALRTQIMGSTNPDGPGAPWVKSRFVKVYAGGKIIPWNTPMKDPISGLRRIFIPMRREDNPYLANNKQYEGMLLAQDSVTRKQWMDGDWDAGSGQFFTEYRPDGPIGQEEQDKYPWARHKVAPVELKPWYYRWASLDIGYDHPATSHKFCRNEADGRIHVYDELSVRQVGAYELGVLLAKWWLPELEALPDHQITLYLSPDAFSKTDATKTRAEQLEMGIKEVLGPYGAIMLRYNSDERAQHDQRVAAAMFDARKREAQGTMCIAIKPANNDVDGGCSYIREMFRFRPILTETTQELKERLHATFDQGGVEAYEGELSKSKSRREDALPKIQIWNACRELDRCLKVAQHDEAPRNERYKKFDAQDGVGGDDALDDFRYGLMAYKEIQTVVPRSYWVNERLSQAQVAHVDAFGSELTDPTRLAMIAQRQNVIYDKSQKNTGGAWTPPRAALGRVIN